MGRHLALFSLTEAQCALRLETGLREPARRSAGRSRSIGTGKCFREHHSSDMGSPKHCNAAIAPVGLVACCLQARPLP
eukprot:scaffold134130_cov31-Tisochrysis_lutea.AAC.1